MTAVNVGQRRMEDALNGPVRDITHIQEGILPFMQNGGGVFYILVNDPWHPRWEMGVIGKL